MLIIDKFEEKQTPSQIAKHIEVIKKKYEGEVIYSVSTITSYDRARLLQQRTPFIVPGNQMYLYTLGIDLREYFRNPEQPKRKKLSPAAQACIAYVLICWEEPKPIKIKTAYFSPIIDIIDYHGVEEKGYTRMTLSRVFKELKSLGIATYDSKTKELNLGKRKALWHKVKNYGKSPIKKVFYIKCEGGFEETLFANGFGYTKPRYAALTALSHDTMIQDDPFQTVATVTHKFEYLCKEIPEIEVVPYAEAGLTKVEIWQYDPWLIVYGNHRNRELSDVSENVDPFSLYFSLQDDKDERVQMCLEELMEKQFND